MNTADIEGNESPDEQHPGSADHPEVGVAVATPPSVGKGKSRPKPPPIERVGQLLRGLYSGQFKRLTLKKPELVAMRSAPFPTESEREELLALAQLDRSLERTRQLMLLGIRLDGPNVPGQLRDFARDVLLRHPVFQHRSLSGVLGNLPESVTEDSAVTALLSQGYASVPWPDEDKPMTKKQYEQCTTNAVHCLLLLFWATRGTSLDRIQRHLQSNLWAPSARRYKTAADKLYALISNRDPAAASVTFGLLEKEAVEQRNQAESARRAEERASARATKLEERLSGVEHQLAEAEVEARRVKLELASAGEEHATAKAHWNDDYEQLRGQMLRRLRETLSLLDEGLHALRRDPPKVHVMVDHAERAIDALKREIGRLRGSD